MNVAIRLSKPSDLKAYSAMLERTYREMYSGKASGLGKEQFTHDIFSRKRIVDYFKGNITLSKKRKTWLAFLDSKMVGAITITDTGEEYELTGFYVLPEIQGKGVGKKLWKKALGFVKGKDVVLDVFAANEKTINTYKKWGFDVDKAKGEFYRHWEEWPEGVSVRSIYMRLKVVDSLRN